MGRGRMEEGGKREDGGERTRTHGNSIRDANDEDGLLEPASASGAEDERLEDLRLECRAQRGEAGELDLLHEGERRLLGSDVVPLDARVHESDLRGRQYRLSLAYGEGRT